MAEALKGIAITASICIMTSMGGRKKDSYLIGLAGASFVLISLLTGMSSTWDAVTESNIVKGIEYIINGFRWIFGI